jgi:hypothetical protein
MNNIINKNNKDEFKIIVTRIYADHFNYTQRTNTGQWKQEKDRRS